MRIELTREQYKKLLELIYMGETVINISKMTRDKDTLLLIKNILSYYKDFKSEHIIEYDKSFDEYYTTPEFDDILQCHLEEYDNYTFWNELAFRLASKDFDKIPENEKKNLNETEIFNMISKLESKYKDEFEKNGVLNLEILKK
ncbi:MAG: hypothetical protein GX287_06225 [Fusobacteria bacterium]|nr:hypothetical protein [Fusobacteriota bacterium]